MNTRFQQCNFWIDQFPSTNIRNWTPLFPKLFSLRLSGIREWQWHLLKLFNSDSHTIFFFLLKGWVHNTTRVRPAAQPVGLSVNMNEFFGHYNCDYWHPTLCDGSSYRLLLVRTTFSDLDSISSVTNLQVKVVFLCICYPIRFKRRMVI